MLGLSDEELAQALEVTAATIRKNGGLTGYGTINVSISLGVGEDGSRTTRALLSGDEDLIGLGGKNYVHHH